MSGPGYSQCQRQWEAALSTGINPARHGQAVTYNATPIIAAGIIYLACLWPLVRLLSRFEHRQIALH